MAGTPGEVPSATRTETAVVNAAGLVQGIVLVTFPAASTIFTDADEYGLTSTEYGFMFLPQVVLAVATSLLGAKLAQRFTTKRVYLVGLLSSTISMSLLIVSTLVKTDTSVAYPLLLVATAFLGAGFGLTVPALNVYAGFFHPAAVDRSVLVLNALLGLGTALAPLFVALFVGLGFWWGLPLLSVVLLLGLLYVSLPLPLRTRRRDPGVGGGRVGHPDEVLVVRCIRRSLRHLRDHERQLVPAGHDVGAGSLYHPGVTRPDRVLGDGHRWPSAVRVDRPLAARPGHLPHPPRGAGGHLHPHGGPATRRPWLGVVVFGLAGLGCSALLPLSISFGQSALPTMSAGVAGGVIAFYQIGYGIAAFGVGPIVDSGRSLSGMFGATAVVAGVLAVLSFLVARGQSSPMPGSRHAATGS